MLEPSAVLEQMRDLKKELIENGIRGMVSLGREPTQLILHAVEGKGPQKLKRHQ